MKPALFTGHTRVFSRAALSSVSTKREIPCIGGDNGLTQQRGSRAPKEPECTTGLAQGGKKGGRSHPLLLPKDHTGFCSQSETQTQERLH